jgi:co-chaperonin GroES (HSP10)
MSDTIKFNNKCIPASEYVVLEVLDRNDSFEVGGLILPTKTFANERVGFYKVISVGKTAADEYGLKTGDYVVADRLAQCYKTEPIAIMKYTNIIAKTDIKNETFSPLRNMVFVKDDPHKATDVGGFLVNNYKKQLNIGEIVAMNIDSDIEVPFSVGDNVMISKGGDSFQIGTMHIFIYKYDMIVCKVVDEEEGV